MYVHRILTIVVAVKLNFRNWGIDIRTGFKSYHMSIIIGNFSGFRSEFLVLEGRK